MVQYQVDAFSKIPFKGNPAAVCILEKEISVELMQNIANENNLSETAFVLKNKESFSIRWFTPTIEVDLCGHATLAAAHILFEQYHYEKQKIILSSKSGDLIVSRQDDLLCMVFPSDILQKKEDHNLNIKLQNSLGVTNIKNVYEGKTDLLIELSNEDTIKKLSPNMYEIAKMTEYRGLIITSISDQYDFVSRFFAPQSGVNEDPVTGSAHTSLIPFWSKKLNKTRMLGAQISTRFGEIHCKIISPEYVEISGYACMVKKTYLFL